MPTPSRSRDFYEVLGCDRRASQTDLKKAYYRLAKKYHPDHNPNDKDAEDKFKEASSAYQVLSNEDQRARYDQLGMDGLRDAHGGAADGFSNVEDIFSAFGDLFGDFFAGRTRGRQAARGTDLRLEITLAFHEAVWGARKEINFTRLTGCSTCQATGNARGSKAEICRNCQGKGQIHHAQGFFMVQTNCPQCLGTGKLIKDPCNDCRGRGTKPEVSTLTLTIPPGVDDGATLRVAGKGESGSGSTAGDLYILLHVTDDDRFDRDGADVTSAVSISFAQAALGGEVEIDTLDDSCESTTILELARGTQPGDLIVRRGQGIPLLNNPGRGDHIIEFKVEVPRTLSSKQEKLLREFVELGESNKPPKRKSR